MSRSYKFSPRKRLHGVQWENFTFTTVKLKQTFYMSAVWVVLEKGGVPLHQ
jgi:hypothetical protein